MQRLAFSRFIGLSSVYLGPLIKSFLKAYIYIILSRINITTMNLLLKVSPFFHDLQVNVLLPKIFFALEKF